MSAAQAGSLSGEERSEQNLECQLYLISPPRLDAGFASLLQSACEAGPVAAFQLRLKDLDQHEIARLAMPLQSICADLDIAFIVNDSIGLAKRLGADGVHLGQDDGDPRDARALLGCDAQIGVTCHASRHLAMEAGEAGADYVAFGSFYQTGTKTVSTYADAEIIRWWTMLSPIPCVAIGGITPDNAAPLVEAGADFIAVSASVWACEEGPAAAVERFSRVLAA